MHTNYIKTIIISILFVIIFIAIADTNANKSKTLPIRELRIFAEIFGRIKQEFVEPVSDGELIRHAIRGMLSGIDPHSAFLSAKEYKSLKESAQGEFGGLGMEVSMEDGFIKIIAPIDDTPAQRAGIKSGDIIIRLGEKSLKDLTISEAVNLMRGPPGSKVNLTIIRKGQKKPIIVNLTRAIIQVKSVKAQIIEPDFGYVRISQFQSHTTQELLKAVDQLKSQARDNLKGLVLDLRNNPGGILNVAVTVSDAFLEKGLIVYTEGREPKSRIEFRAGPEDILAGAPIVVLINNGSASASEIVAGALQDHKRALIVGTQSFGKGSVQTVIPIEVDDHNTALKLTTARYYTPSGRSIQAEGITPDIELKAAHVTVKEHSNNLLKESSFAKHLSRKPSNRIQITNSSQSAPHNAQSKAKKPLAERDYQLSEALNLLKGLSLMRQAPKPVFKGR